jgi:glutamyl-Q tRNA(Asp) synthetase
MPDTTPYVGRFAPSPTGPLHFGSLIAALASYLDARAGNGRWLLRIEDIDPPREQPGASAAIVDTLRRHGLHWDGDLLYQSRRLPLYREALARLLAQGDAFPCGCTRATLAAGGGLHRGRCRTPERPCAVRLRVDDEEVAVDDALQGRFSQALARQVGDFVIWRREDLPAYQLAVVVDDGAQGVTHVVRGCDLLDNTPRQVLLQRRLGLPVPRYAHLPVIANALGQKLSKQTFARALDGADAAANLRAALDFLGQPAPPPDRGTAAAILDWAIRHWSLAAVPRATHLGGERLPPSCRAFAS